MVRTKEPRSQPARAIYYSPQAIPSLIPSQPELKEQSLRKTQNEIKTWNLPSATTFFASHTTAPRFPLRGARTVDLNPEAEEKVEVEAEKEKLALLAALQVGILSLLACATELSWKQVSRAMVYRIYFLQWPLCPAV